ncbi:MAG: penicillin-binding transpeptidase domain-containing protein [Bacteroidota bacterium]|nr:penicillin-binding transpeptidase domain-containing protein [Bacteroidota bacterium]
MGRFLIYALIPLLLMGCKTSNVKEDDSLKAYFDSAGVTGCFALFNNSQNDFTIYNLSRYRDSSYTPASTFKIVNSLIGIQTGKISDENMLIKWDGVTRQNQDWNKDLTMKQAFAVSSVPYYQEVARRIGHDTMKHWIDSLGYGNRDISGPVDSFWLNNTLKLKPDEELGLVKKLYFSDLPFFHRTQEIVKKVMLREEDTNYKLSYKTGWGQNENGDQLGWVVGWIEENRHPYFFVLNLESPDKNIDMPNVRLHILKGILSHLGFFNGKK